MQDWDKDIAGVANKIVKPWTDNTDKANAYADDGAFRKVGDQVTLIERIVRKSLEIVLRT